jgi:hypothetical protein
MNLYKIRIAFLSLSICSISDGLLAQEIDVRIKRMLPRDDSARAVFYHLVPIEAMRHTNINTYTFSLGASMKNIIPKHSVSVMLTLPIEFKDISDINSIGEPFDFVSQGYKRPTRKEFTAEWKYFYKATPKMDAIIPVKNADSVTQNLPYLSISNEKRSYLRGGITFAVFPRQMNFLRADTITSDMFFPEGGKYLHKERALTIHVGYEVVKERFSSVSLNNMEFRNYRKLRRSYVDILLQPFKIFGKLSYLNAQNNGEGQLALTEYPLSFGAQNELRQRFRQLPIGVRAGYGFDFIANSPLGFSLETGLYPGIVPKGNLGVAYYMKAKIKLDIRNKE